MLEARKQGKTAYLKVDKLFIDKTLYKGSDQDKSESVLKCLSWNIKGLSADKRTSQDFTDFISKYDIICLSETWTNSKSNIHLNNYSKPIHSYRRFQNRRAMRPSGGIIIYIKDSIRKGITVVRNNIDCIVWLKLDKTFFNLESHIYLCATYISPESSPVHDIYDIDLFMQLEQDITYFSQFGNVFVSGDTNSRVAQKKVSTYSFCSVHNYACSYYVFVHVHVCIYLCNVVMSY